MSASKAKGTWAETHVVDYLRECYWPNAERRALEGAKDRGDIDSTPALVWEIKNAARITLPEWMRETERERQNANADYGILVVKPKGYGATRVGEWPAVVSLWVMTEMLNKLGYGGTK